METGFKQHGLHGKAQVEEFIPLITSQMASSDTESMDDVIDGTPWAGRSQVVRVSYTIYFNAFVNQE